jgi:hypothetical protein
VAPPLPRPAAPTPRPHRRRDADPRLRGPPPPIRQDWQPRALGRRQRLLCRWGG